jgi:ABC-2 type transport system permease protein
MNPNITQDALAFVPTKPASHFRDFIDMLMITLAMLRRDLVVMRRQSVSFATQVLLQPVFILLIFGAVLPTVGIAQRGYGTLLLPGVVAFTIVNTALQWIALPLVLDLGYGREIDDRLLAPLPTGLVAIEKVIFAAMRGLIAGVVIFPLAYILLGNEFSMRMDAIGLTICVMILSALAAASLGLMVGTIVVPGQINLAFLLILIPLLFTGCVQYPWGALNSLKWLQIISLFNPLTYASEGLRYAVVPHIHGHAVPTLGIGWSLLGLVVSFVGFLWVGVWKFQRRVVS